MSTTRTGSRKEILARLATAPATAAQLASACGTTSPSMSRRLIGLKNAGHVTKASKAVYPPPNYRPVTVWEITDGGHDWMVANDEVYAEGAASV